MQIQKLFPHFQRNFELVFFARNIIKCIYSFRCFQYEEMFQHPSTLLRVSNCRDEIFQESTCNNLVHGMDLGLQIPQVLIKLLME